MIKESTLYMSLLATSKEFPDRPALIYMNRKITYAELIKDVHRLARGLIERGVKRDDIVSVCLPNIPSVVHLLYAINQIGAIANIVHPLVKRPQMETILMETGSRLLFCLDTTYFEFMNLATCGVEVVSCSPVAELAFPLRLMYRLANRKKLKSLQKGVVVKAIAEYYDARENREFDCDIRKDAFYLHSGGTTGKPKVIALSSSAVNALASNGLRILNLTQTKDKYMLAVLPIFHGFGLCMGMHACLAFGACNTLMPKFNAGQVVAYLKKGKISFIIGVPILFEALLRNPKFAGRMLENLDVAFVGGDFVSPSLIQRFDQRMKENGSRARLCEGYGLTEVVTVCTVNTIADHRMGSVGKILPNVIMKVVDCQSKEDLPPMEYGELYVSGETMMNGYRFLAKGEAQPFVTDGDGRTWVATGDYGAIDEDDFVFFRQRIKRIIKVSGINVFPSEVESAAMEVKAIHECAAISVSDEQLGNAIKLFVVLDRAYKGDKPDVAIRASIEKRCGIYAVPRHIAYVESLPKTMVGKVDTKELR